MGRAANTEMIEGFRDGYDLNAPEPSENRSRSYRHGFLAGRIDRGAAKSPGFEAMERMADEAMDVDALGHRYWNVV